MDKKKISFIILSVILFISFSYFVYANELDNDKIDVYFDNLEIDNGSVSDYNINIDNNSIVYGAILYIPGDYFMFNVDIVNNNDYNVSVDSFSSLINGKKITNNIIPSYMDYYVRYSDGTEVNNKDIIKSRDKVKLKICLMYKRDITIEDLEKVPANNAFFNFSFNINYVKAD